MEITTTGKKGALTTYKITGADQGMLDAVKNITPRSVYLDGDVISGSCNKREYRQLQDCVRVRSQPKRSGNVSGRYIELLDVAERERLNHGKPWLADGFVVDKNSLDPSWEGCYICYVYPN